MNELPEEIHQIANAIALQLDDADEAAKVIEGRVKSLPNYPDIVNDLVARSIRDLTYQKRHQENRRLRHEQYHSTPKVDSLSDDVSKVERSFYDSYYVNGTTIGNLTGSMLDIEIHKAESNVKTHRFHIELFESLRDLVGDQERVRDRVTEKTLVKMFDKLRQQHGMSRKPQTV